MKKMTAKYCTIQKEVEGELLVSHKPLSFLGGVNLTNGQIIDPESDIYGQSMKDKILVYPFGKGSTGDCLRLYAVFCRGCGPKAIVNVEPDPIQLEGALLCEIPTLFGFEENIYEYLETGRKAAVSGNELTIL